MHALPAVATLSLLEALPSDAPTAPPSAPPALAKAAAATVQLAPPDLHLPRAGLDVGNMVAPVLLLLVLGAAAVWLARRRRAPGRRVVVLETTSLGPKRSLVLAQLEDEVLLLGASEAGIQLLKIRPADELSEAPRSPAEEAHGRGRRLEPPAALSGLVARLRRVRPAPRFLEDFDDLLSECSEDQDLRAKLARGQAGSVR